jgi:hypothetical protein
MHDSVVHGRELKRADVSEVGQVGKILETHTAGL